MERIFDRHLFRLNSNDIVLDIGCGPGYLESCWKDEVREIHGIDTSDRYIKQCKERFAGQSNVHFYLLPNTNYTDLSVFGEKRFSLIVCMSVIQYYDDLYEVRKLIESVKMRAKAGAQFLITDIPVHSSPITDTLTEVYEGIRNHYLLEVIKLLFKGRFSDYFKLRKSKGLLVLSKESLIELGKLGKKYKILRNRITVNGGRQHLLITF